MALAFTGQGTAAYLRGGFLLAGILCLIGLVGPAVANSYATLKLQRHVALAVSLLVFAIGHVTVAVISDFTVILAARFLTALATGAFWAVAAVIAANWCPSCARQRAPSSACQLSTVSPWPTQLTRKRSLPVI